jgi:hypothetical protein
LEHLGGCVEGHRPSGGGGCADCAEQRAGTCANVDYQASAAQFEMPDETGGGRQYHWAPERLVGIDTPVVAVSNVGPPWPGRFSLVRHDVIFRALRLTVRLVLGR